MMNLRLKWTVAGAGMLAGCAVGPDYRPPQVSAPAQYVGAATTQPATQSTTIAAPVLNAWWRTFNDPVLDRLMEQAKQSNLDLRIAEARLREARAQRGVVSADYYPTLDASAGYSRSKSSRNAFPGGVAGAGAGGAGGAGTGGTSGGSSVALGSERDLWQAGFDAAWEVDVFGGVRRSVEAADADIQASIADLQNVLVSLLGEVARNYVELRGFQRQIAIAEDNAKAQEQTLSLTQAKFKAGLSSDLDVARAEAQVSSTRATIPSFQAAAQQTAHRIAVLTGQAPEALIDELGRPQAVPIPPPEIAVGLPSDLLRRRPDIRSAERQLAAATARIGIATSDLFPRFTLNGTLGLQSSSFSNWADSNSTFWSIGPGVRWPIFNAGRIRANIRVQSARTDAALANYQNTVLQSLEEVENALVAFDREQARRRILSSAVDSNRRAVDLSQQLYQRGVSPFLDVLDAQRALYLSQDQLSQSDTTVSANAVALFKALGGGWEPEQTAQAR
jgi:NodT family efflux transporter outer membrane factor (OMF) lipoprotein